MSDAELRRLERQLLNDGMDVVAQARLMAAFLRTAPQLVARSAIEAVMANALPSSSCGLVSVADIASAIEEAEAQRTRKGRYPRPGVAFAHGARRSGDTPQFETARVSHPAYPMEELEPRTARNLNGRTVYRCPRVGLTLAGLCYDGPRDCGIHVEVGRVEMWHDTHARIRLKPERVTSQVALVVAYDGCMTLGLGLASAKGALTPGAAWDFLWPWVTDCYIGSKTHYQLGVKAGSWRKLAAWSHRGEDMPTRQDYQEAVKLFRAPLTIFRPGHQDARLTGVEPLGSDRIHGPTEAFLAWAKEAKAKEAKGGLFR